MVPTIARKEFRDYFTSPKFWAIYMIFNLLLISSAYLGVQDYNEQVKKYEEELRKFKEGELGVKDAPIYKLGVPEPSILIAFKRIPQYIAMVGALLGIIVGFDAISGERNSGTLRVLLSYPVFRDKIINDKYIGRIGVIAISAILAILMAFGLLMILVKNISWDELSRLITFVLISIAYLSFFVGIGIFFSIISKDSNTSLITCIVFWLFSVYLITPISKLISTLIYPVPRVVRWGNFNELERQAIDEVINSHFQLMEKIMIISPSYNYQRLSHFILNPFASGERSYSFTSIDMLRFSPVSLPESLLYTWPSLVILCSGLLVVFIISYIVFMRQDIK